MGVTYTTTYTCVRCGIQYSVTMNSLYEDADKALRDMWAVPHTPLMVCTLCQRVLAGEIDKEGDTC